MRIGIDPDIDKSGVAVLSAELKMLKAMRFFDLIEFLNKHKSVITCVHIEASWLRPHNWHANKYNGVNVASSIGKDIGANHQVGRLIAEYCKENKIKYFLEMPKKLVWGRGNEKIKHTELIKHFSKRYEFLKNYKTTNKEVRDAFLLIA
jgi:hypothetical protein